jgi:hypothetical protein
LHLLSVGTQRQAEHVGHDLAADSLLLKRLRQIQEDPVGDLRHRRPTAAAGGNLGDQDRRLAHDAVQQDAYVHAVNLRGAGHANQGDFSPLLLVPAASRLPSFGFQCTTNCRRFEPAALPSRR